MNLLDREAHALFHTYKRIPLEIVRGEGIHLVAENGTRYLDMFSGLAVNALGYGHPLILRAVEDQVNKYIHLSNYYLQEPQVELAELLLKYSGYARVFLANTGTEAVEGAIKIARRWGSLHGKVEIVSCSNAFHGRTYGALSLMDRPKYRNSFGPFLTNCRIVSFNNSEELRTTVGEQTIAVILECIQGEGGIRPISQEFAAELGELKQKFGFLIIADEIQSGIGRTGKFFGFQHFDLQPDIVVLAKPIGGGLPLGAILGKTHVADVLEPGMHGTTFGGNPVACAAGVVVLQEIMENGLMRNAEAMGNVLKAGLLSLKDEFPKTIREVRGYGLMVGAELDREGDPIVTAMREKHVLINCTDQNVLRFLPPLIVREEHVQETIKSLGEVLREG